MQGILRRMFDNIKKIELILDQILGPGPGPLPRARFWAQHFGKNTQISRRIGPKWAQIGLFQRGSLNYPLNDLFYLFYLTGLLNQVLLYLL